MLLRDAVPQLAGTCKQMQALQGVCPHYIIGHSWQRCERRAASRYGTRAAAAAAAAPASSVSQGRSGSHLCAFATRMQFINATVLQWQCTTIESASSWAAQQCPTGIGRVRECAHCTHI